LWKNTSLLDRPLSDDVASQSENSLETLDKKLNVEPVFSEP